MKTFAAFAALLIALGLSSAQGNDGDSSVRLLIRDASRALQAGNAPLFLGAFDADAVENFDRFSESVRALLAQKTPASSVSTGPVRVDGDQATVTVDWLLQIRARNGIGLVETRRESVHLELRRRGKKWKITDFAPMDFLDPRTETARP